MDSVISISELMNTAPQVPFLSYVLPVILPLFLLFSTSLSLVESSFEQYEREYPCNQN
jgi:hypothetical protein